MSFKTIKGQDKPIGLLKNYLEQNHLASSYLFVGPEGAGKGLVARTLAKVVNCQEEEADSCDSCISCSKIERNQHPDIHIFGSAASDDLAQSEAIKIDEIRALQKEISLRPYEGKKKVFIIDNAHNLSAEAANALLKILEEPPKRSLIILVTAKPEFLFKTIISRCAILKFSALPRNKLEAVLKDDYKLPLEQAHFLAFYAEGRLGFALRLKDSNIFRDKNKIIDGLIAPEKPIPESLLLKEKEDLRLYLNLTATWLRDLYLVKTGCPHTELINFDRRDELLKSMHRYTFGELDESLNHIFNSLLYLEQKVNMKLVLSCLRNSLKRQGG